MKHSFGILVASLGFVASQASASEEDDLFSLSLEQLMQLKIYSASKSYQAVEDIPASVVIINRKQIEQMGYTTLDEILQHVPGFYLIDNYENQLVGVRGSIGGNLAYLVNGILRHPTNVPTQTSVDRGRMNIPVESIDRIEIVRGSQAVTYGNSAFYGSINIITNNTDNTSQVSISAGDNQQGRLFARATQVYDRGSVVVNAGYWQSDGIGGDLVDTMDEESFAALHPAMRTSLDGLLSHENYNLDLSGKLDNFYSNILYSQMNYGFYVFTPSYDEGNLLRLKDRLFALGYEDEVGEQWSYTLEYIYSHQSYDVDQFDFAVPDFSGAGQSQYSKRQAIDAYGKYQLNKSASLLLGLWYQTVKSKNDVSLPVPVSVFRSDSTDDFIYKDIYSKFDYSPNQTLDLSLGVRYHHVDDYTSHLDDGTTKSSISSESSDVFLPQASAVYHLNARDRLKLLYGKANQTPRISSSNQKDEVIENLEIQYLFFHNNILVNSSLFLNKIENLQRVTQTIKNGQVVKTYDNSGKLEVYGLEFSLRQEISERFYYNLSASYQSSKDVNNPSLDPGYSPRFLAKADASYSIANYTFSILMDYVGSMSADWQFSDTVLGETYRIGNDVDAYTNLGFNVRYDMENGIYASCKFSNLLNEDIRYPATELVDFEGGGFGHERHFLMSLGYKF